MPELNAAEDLSPRVPFLARTRLTVNALCFLCIVGVLLPGPFEALLADYGSDLERPLPRRALGHYRAMKAHFEAPFERYGAIDVFVPQFAAVFLSHAAAGFYNVSLSDPSRRDEVARLLDEVVRRAVSPEVSPYRRSPESVGAFGDHNLYLSHLNLILGIRCRVRGDGAYDELHERISRHLASKSLSSGTAHARSYPGSARFPADQTVTLASLDLYDRCHGTTLSKRPIERWLSYMKRSATDRSTGLHRSSVTPSYKNGRVPRGCALSWSLLYMAQFAPDQARELYVRYRRQYLTDVLGWGGFREYPEGTDAPMNVDSGPIVFGLGMAATGLGLGPARIFGDRRAYVSIMRTAASVGLPTLSPWRRSYRLAPLLGEAILFHGMTARRWDMAPVEDPVGDEAPFPTGALAMVLASLALALVHLRNTVRLVAVLRGVRRGARRS